MKILSIDTAHGICSVALAEDGVILSAKTDNEASAQAERLFLTINNLLKENDLSYQDLGAIAADIGPGSFTGVRIGFAASRGIALAAGIPIIGVTGFEALAFAAKTDANYENLLVAMDAKRGQVYTQIFSHKNASEQLLLDYNDITTIVNTKNNLTIIGDGANLIEPYLQNSKISYSILDGFTLPDASMVALVAFEKMRNGDYNENPSPLYIRKPDAKLPKSAGIA